MLTHTVRPVMKLSLEHYTKLRHIYIAWETVNHVIGGVLTEIGRLYSILMKGGIQ